MVKNLLEYANRIIASISVTVFQLLDLQRKILLNFSLFELQSIEPNIQRLI